MTLKSEAYSLDYPELRVTYMDESFEVDGILYTPPWVADSNDPARTSVSYAPMFELKEDYWCPPENFEYL